MSKINELPSLSTASNNDLLLIWNTNTDTTKQIKVGSLFSQISSGNNSSWLKVNSDFTAQSGNKLINTASADITINLPTVTTGEIELFNVSASSKIFINLQGQKYNSGNYSTSNLVFKGANSYVKLIYFSDAVGWYPLFGQLDTFNIYPSDMALWLEGGNLTDKSGNSRNATPIGTNSPSIATGIDGKQVLRWNGSGNQELQVTPFLSNTTGATLYCVFSISANTNYNLIRTANLDDYWRFTQNGSGYFGTFRNSRFEAYPSGMPSTGHHLISIHASNNSYEVILDNVSKGAQSSIYTPGDRFRIATNDKAFNGDIALILIYPSCIDKTSNTHANCMQAIKYFYPSLPFNI